MKDLLIIEEVPIPVRREIVVLPEDDPGLGWPVIELHGIGVVSASGTCMFDSLPPGVYGLVCSCPRCSTWSTSL